MTKPSSQYLQLYKRGPFPGRIDPWAEVGWYFHQLHSEIISELISQIQDPLLQLGYIAAREANLQIIGNRQPDIHISHAVEPSREPTFDYAAAATAVSAQPGTAIMSSEPELDAIHIMDEAGELVT